VELSGQTLPITADYYISQADFTLVRVTASASGTISGVTVNEKIVQNYTKYGEKVKVTLPAACKGKSTSAGAFISQLPREFDSPAVLAASLGIAVHHTLAFQVFGSAGRSSYALHGTVLCAPNGTSGEVMKTVLRVVRRRLVYGFGDVHVQVARLGKTCIVVRSDPITRRQSVLAALAVPGYMALTNAGRNFLASGRRVRLSCKNLGPDCPSGSKVGATNLKAKPFPILQIVVPGTYVEPGSARLGFDQAGHAITTYVLTGQGRAAWCAFTSTHVGGYSAIVLDNVVLVDPEIMGAICGGQTEIAGLSTTQEAKRVAIFLNYGALPVALHVTGTQ